MSRKGIKSAIMIAVPLIIFMGLVIGIENITLASETEQPETRVFMMPKEEKVVRTEVIDLYKDSESETVDLVSDSTLDLFEKADESRLVEIISQKQEEEEIERMRKQLEQGKEAVKIQNQNRINTFIENKNEFLSLDLRTKTGFTSEDYRKMLAQTNLISIADALVQAENEYSVNGLFLMSIAALESGWGNSTMARSKNNITGFQAYDYATHKARRFESFSDCILTTAKLLSENYLSEDGKYFNGYTLTSVNKRYSSSNEWANKVANVMKGHIEKLD